MESRGVSNAALRQKKKIIIVVLIGLLVLGTAVSLMRYKYLRSPQYIAKTFMAALSDGDYAAVYDLSLHSAPGQDEVSKREYVSSVMFLRSNKPPKEKAETITPAEPVFNSASQANITVSVTYEAADKKKEADYHTPAKFVLTLIRQEENWLISEINGRPPVSGRESLDAITTVVQTFIEAWKAHDYKSMLGYLSQDYIEQNYGSAPYEARLNEFCKQWEAKYGPMSGSACTWRYVRRQNDEATIPVKFIFTRKNKNPWFIPYLIEFHIDPSSGKWKITSLQETKKYQVPTDALKENASGKAVGYGEKTKASGTAQ